MSRRFQTLSCFALVLVLVLGMTAPPVSALSSDEIQDQIDALKEEASLIRDKIEELEQQLGENLQEMTQLVQQKNSIDLQIVLLNEQVTNINDRIHAYGMLVADQQEELDAAKENLRILNGKYRDRIRAMEEEGTISYWTVLFRSSSFTGFLDRLNIIREIAEADQKRLEELAAASNRVEDAKAELESEKDALLSAREELEAS